MQLASGLPYDGASIVTLNVQDAIQNNADGSQSSESKLEATVKVTSQRGASEYTVADLTICKHAPNVTVGDCMHSISAKKKQAENFD